jgi:HEAT repeats/BNR/Asp-box repeat
MKMKRIDLNAFKERIRVRRFAMTLLGVAIGLTLITGAAAVYFVNVAATPLTASEARIQGWVFQLSNEQLTPARHLAQQHLEESGDAAVDPLISALHSPDSALRRNSAEMLGFIASPRALDALTTTLENDPVASVRSRAAWSLGELHDLGAVGALQNASVRDQDLRVRQEAASSIGALRSFLAQGAGKNEEMTSAFAISPSENAVVYLSEMNQVSVSRDGGKTWSATGGALPSRVSALAVSPSNPNLLYAGTESMGLYESTDGGATWVAKSQGLGIEPGVRLTVTAIAVDPQIANRLYVATGTWVGSDQATLLPVGVLRSLDGGNTWQAANMPTSSTAISRLVILGNELYASAGDEISTLPL